nr:retrotransposon Gag domain, retroviral aspartyl protease [Tanacetum cinerariifolium]
MTFECYPTISMSKPSSYFEMGETVAGARVYWVNGFSCDGGFCLWVGFETRPEILFTFSVLLRIDLVGQKKEEVVGPDVGELLVVRRALNSVPVREEKLQREAIFHTRCTVAQKICSVIIDGGSCTNVASQTMVSKLNLPTESDPSPYVIHCRKSENSNPPDPIATQLAAIAAKLEAFEKMKEDIAALKEGQRSRNGEGESSWRGRQPQRPYNKYDFPIFSSGDPRGWMMKAEKYFRYYQIPDEEKVEMASMHLEGDALNLYSWLSHDQTVIFWEELVQAFTRSFGSAEFQNPDEFLCSIKQTGSAEEDMEEPPVTQFFNPDDQEETAEISLHAILAKPHPTTMKVRDVLVNELKPTSKPMAPFGVQIGNEDIIRCSNICKNLPVQINELKITQD